jgi:hypothetical protein
MWLPTPIYERVPQFWLLLGLLFMTSGTYLGFDYSLSFVYFGVGFVCCIWSLWTFSMRLTARKDQRQHPILEAAEDQQAEAVDAGAKPAA